MRFWKTLLKKTPRLKMRTRHPKHTEERIKLAASGLQLLAIALVGAAFIAPMFNSSLGAPAWITAPAAFVAALLEGAAMIILRYIPVSPIPDAVKEPNNG